MLLCVVVWCGVVVCGVAWCSVVVCGVACCGVLRVVVCCGVVVLWCCGVVLCCVLWEVALTQIILVLRRIHADTASSLEMSTHDT